MEATFGLNNSFGRFVDLNDGSADNQHRFGINTNEGIRLKVADGGSTQANLDSSSSNLAGTRAIFAATAEANNMQVWVDGTSVGTDSSGTMPGSLDTVEVGSTGGSTSLGGVIHKINIFEQTGFKG